MRRREFICFLGGTALGWPLAARAQRPGQKQRIGVLMASAESDSDGQVRIGAFRKMIDELGWTDGRDVRIDCRWAAGESHRFRTAAAELVSLEPDVILGDATPSVAALQRETRTIPIVFVRVGDPVGSGFVENIANPGGNITGFTSHEFSLGGKWLELLREVSPHVARVALIFDPTTFPQGNPFLRPAEAAAPLFGITAIPAPVQDTAEIDRTIDAFARESDGALVLLPDPFTVVHRERIAARAVQHRLPTIASFRPFVAGGGLMSYGSNPVDLYRRAAVYVDRILRGAKPSQLPVQAPTKYELVISLKTAAALGVTIPSSILLRADEVIE